MVLTQGKNVLRGDRLMVDMTTGVSRVESKNGRVQGLFQSSGQGGPLSGPVPLLRILTKTEMISINCQGSRGKRLNLPPPVCIYRERS